MEILVDPACRVVLDTNVCLDLFVFHDSRCGDLHAALLERKIEAVTREDCRREWELVLAYPHLPLNEASRAQVAAEFDRHIRCLSSEHMASREETVLPKCRDRDDQKFLELARDAGAALLITKDKALLRLARRTAKAGLFRIVSPHDWQAALFPPSA